MYHMTPYTADFSVEPAKIMYHMPDYHENQSENDASTKSTSINGGSLFAAKKIDEQQHTLTVKNKSNNDDDEELIRRLLSLHLKLDQFLMCNNSKSTKANRLEANKEILVEKPSGKKPSGTTEQKISKKENREAAKYNSTKPKQHEIDDLIEFRLTSTTQNSPYKEHVKIQPTAPVFPIHNYGPESMQKNFAQKTIKCILRNQDSALVKLLNRIGQKRNVQLIETDKRNAKNSQQQVYIEVKYDDNSEMHLNIDDKFVLHDEQSIWKFIGSLLGLYSSEDSFVSALTDKWILMAIVNSDDIDNLSRQLNAYLASTDFLSSPHAILLADIVLRGKFTHGTELVSWENAKAANNVQLWIQRVDIALNCYC